MGSSTSTPGSNLTMITWATPVSATRIELASVPKAGRFDIGDLAPDPRGLILLRGLDVGLDGKADSGLGEILIG